MIEVGHSTLQEEGSLNCSAFSIGWPCHGAGILVLSLRADLHLQREQKGISVMACVPLPLLLAGLFVLAAKDSGNITACRTLLGHNGLHNLIILIGINREDNSIFQLE